MPRRSAILSTLADTTMVMKKVECRDCRHFKEAPYEGPRTGCYFPDFMPQKQKDAFLKEQEIPGDHRKLNLRGDCPQWEARPKKPSLWKRLFASEV